MKSAHSEDFKTDLTFDIWPSRIWKNWGQTRGHFHFSHEYVRYYPFSAVVTTLLDFQSIILTSCFTFFDIFITNDQAFTPKNATDIDFFQFFVEITQKNDFKLPENVKTENDPWCLWPQFFQLQLGQMSKVRSVLKSSEQADFKTDLPFWIWWRFEVVIAKKRKC